MTISINVRRPRKGDFSVLFDEENCLVGSPFAFLFSDTASTDPHPNNQRASNLHAALTENSRP